LPLLRVLNFHGIGTPERELEPGEAPYWITPEHFGAILDLAAARADRDGIRITFDDGNRSDLTLATPALAARGWRATFFVLTGRIGAPGSLGGDDIVALLEAGMAIGSHGVAHVDWRQLDAAGLQAELSDSRQRLEEICGHPIVAAAIPFGAYNGRVLKGLAAAGYREAYSSDGGPTAEGAFLRPRQTIRVDTTLPEVSAFLAGEEPLGRRLRRRVAIAIKRRR